MNWIQLFGLFYTFGTNQRLGMKYLLIGVLCLGIASCNSVSEKKKAKDEVAKVNKNRGEYNLAYRNIKNPDLKSTDLSPRTYSIIDVHEHLQTVEDAKRLLKAMDKLNITRCCLMASSYYTFTLNDKYGFERFKENNELLLQSRNSYPDRFSAFITIDPEDKDNLILVKDYVSRGADGIKLYLGHGAGTGKGPFHSMPLDDPRMLSIYEWAEKTQLPILFHVNLIKYYDEFIRVMDSYPLLKVCIPHFGLHKNTEKRLTRLASIFARYPNVYTDISFGHEDFHIEGFETLSKWRTRSKEFVEKHADRIMFGTDMVLEKTKTIEYIENTLRSYMQWIEDKEFCFFYKPDYPMWGLSLSEESLRKIYQETAKKFLSMDDFGMLPDRIVRD